MARPTDILLVVLGGGEAACDKVQDAIRAAAGDNLLALSRTPIEGDGPSGGLPPKDAPVAAPEHQESWVDASDVMVEVLVGRFAEVFGLTPREADVMLGYVQGYNIPVIAKELFISPNTVKTHTTHIYRKTGVENRQQLWDLFARTFRGGKR